MFANQRGNAGLGNIIAVAALVGLYLATAGMMWKSYREGGTNATGGRCEVACRQVVAKSPSHG